MSHSFDTGLLSAQRTLIRDGVVSLLSGLLIANGGYLRAVIPWGGVIRGYTDVEGVDLLWAALNGRSPAIAVGLGDRSLQAAGAGGFNFRGDLELVLYHHNNHPLSITDGRTKISTRALASDLRDPGLEIAMEHAEELVIGQRVGAAPVTNVVGETTRATPTIKRIRPTREEELRTDNTLTLWACRFAVEVERTINPHRGVTQLLTELRTKIRTSDDAMDPPAAPVLENQTLTT